MTGNMKSLLEEIKFMLVKTKMCHVKLHPVNNSLELSHMAQLLGN